MILCNCIVQDGQISLETETTLRAALSDFAIRAFGAPAEIKWLTIPERSGFTAGKSSTSSVISMQANAPLSQEDRESLLKELCAVWTRETNCTLADVVCVISDPN